MREGFPPPENIDRKNSGDQPSRRDFLKKSAAVFGSLLAGRAASAEAPAAETKETDAWPEIRDSVKKLEDMFRLKPDQYALVVDPRRQKLYLIRNDAIEKEYAVSTAAAGIGNVADSNQTPYGTHEIFSKLGSGKEAGTIYGKGKFGGKAEIITEPAQAKTDLITSRVLKLRGLEPNINSGTDKAGHSVNSETRGIYIHGTNEEGLLGRPESHGCVRMANRDVIELFDLVPEHTLVEIQNKEYLQEKE